MYIADSVGQSSAAQRRASCWDCKLNKAATNTNTNTQQQPYTHAHTCCNAMLQLNFHIDIWRQNDKL